MKALQEEFSFRFILHR